MGRWDVQVLGVDEGKPATTVLDAVAKRLGAELGQVQRLLAHAPTTLVADLDEGAAKTLVQELRAMGLRVKPRPSTAATEPSAPPVMTPPPQRAVDERATAPTISLPIPGTRNSPVDSVLPLPASPGSPLERLEAADMRGASGLELEDVPLPPARVQRPMSLPPGAPALTPTPAAPVVDTSEPDEPPREFWSALPQAFLVPLRRGVVGGLIAAPICMGVAVMCSILGTLTAIVGVLVMTAAFVGVTLQVAHRCLWATAAGEREPASLPFDFLAEYAFPGITVVIVQGAMGSMLGWAGMHAIAAGVPVVAIQGGVVFFALYSVVGFALAAASRSALGFLDFARILRIMTLAPVEVGTIAIIGAILQGGAIAIAAAQFAAAFASGGGIGSALLALAGSVVIVSFAACYGSAVSATMMGMLFWARPEVAGK